MAAWVGWVGGCYLLVCILDVDKLGLLSRNLHCTYGRTTLFVGGWLG